MEQTISDAKSFIGYSLSELLFASCYIGDKTLVRGLIIEGADVNSVNSECKTSLFIACEEGHSELVGLLIRAGANTDTPNSYNNFRPLHIACRLGHLHVVTELLDNKADPNVSAGGLTPLMIACMYGMESEAKALINGGANPNILSNQYSTAVSIAVERGYTDCANAIKNSGSVENVVIRRLRRFGKMMSNTNYVRYMLLTLCLPKN